MRAKTQDELIADALETEESNIASLNTFLTEEEERKLKNANMKKTVIDGPLLRWVSRTEKVKLPMVVEVEIPAYPRPYQPYRALSSPLMEPLSRPLPPIPPIAPLPPKQPLPPTVTQARNYVTLDTPKEASPAQDYAYLFGSHVDWGTLNVLPKNHPPRAYQALIVPHGCTDVHAY